MHTRRDQVQAHLFTLSRVTAGLIRAEPDAAETPMQRFTLGAVAGTAVGALALGGLMAFGFISPGITNNFKKQGTIVLEKETGTRYVFLDGALHPVLNHTSAILISGKAPNQSRGGVLRGNQGITSVSSKSLKDVPKGPPVGIVGAPDFLPEAKRLDRGSWSVCSASVRQPDGTDKKTVTAYLGGAGEGVTELNDKQTRLVKGDDGTSYLSWLDRKLKVSSQAALIGLGYGDATAFGVKDSWLNSLPSGSDLKGLDVPGRGTAGPPIGGRATVVGQVYRDPGGETFLLMADGLSPLTQTEAALVLADPESQKAYPGGQVVPLELATSAVAAAPRSARDPKLTGFPQVLPEAIANGATGVRVPCYRILPGAGDNGTAALRAAFRETPPDSVTKGLPGVARPVPPGGLVADRVVVPPGSGMLVREEAPVGEAAPKLYLITDVGQKFQLSTPELARKLGYDETKAVPMPAGVLALVPNGPVLDEAAARTPLAANP
ncbi:type VII secretion protein EccB [Streptomyces sp. NPDC058583]|uniref:type VII secretion protein EccB n=1 Tax=unclassified Streptomyces TaxID=2593676 RepID=UPI00365A84EB